MDPFKVLLCVALAVLLGPFVIPLFLIYVGWDLTDTYLRKKPVDHRPPHYQS